jgi:F-type H+-transporting ATPase subunit b
MKLIDIASAAEKAHEVATTVASHTTEPEGLLASLGIQPTLFVFQLINFAVVVLIIWFLILKPLTTKMTERQDKIEKGLKNAEEVEENLRKSESKYQEKIDEAKSAAAKILTTANLEAKEVGEKMKEKSKQEIELLVDQAKRNINIEKDEMITEIKVQAGELVTIALEKILEEKIDDRKDKEMILRSVKNIKV